MHAIEFRTKIKDGIIRIPKEHRNTIKENVRVIVFTEENSVDIDAIERLLKSPLKPGSSHLSPEMKSMSVFE